MANKGFKAKEPKRNCIIILRGSKNVIKVKRDLNLYDANKYLLKIYSMLGLCQVFKNLILNEIIKREMFDNQKVYKNNAREHWLEFGLRPM